MKARFEELRSKKEGQGGFTLIELLIVIVILGILSTVVIFGVANFRSNAEQNACDTTKQTINTAGQAYLANVGATTIPGADSDARIATLVTGDYLQSSPQTTYGSLTTITLADDGVVAGCA